MHSLAPVASPQLVIVSIAPRIVGDRIRRTTRLVTVNDDDTEDARSNRHGRRARSWTWSCPCCGREA